MRRAVVRSCSACVALRCALENQMNWKCLLEYSRRTTTTATATTTSTLAERTNECTNERTRASLIEWIERTSEVRRTSERQREWACTRVREAPHSVGSSEIKAFLADVTTSEWVSEWVEAVAAPYVHWVSCCCLRLHLCVCMVNFRRASSSSIVAGNSDGRSLLG